MFDSMTQPMTQEPRPYAVGDRLAFGGLNVGQVEHVLFDRDGQPVYIIRELRAGKPMLTLRVIPAREIRGKYDHR